MRLGSQTATFVSKSENVNVLDDYGHPAIVETSTDVPGCLFRSMIPAYRGDKKVTELGELTIDQWRLTAPPDPAVLAAKANDEIIVNGRRFHIVVGPRLFYNLRGDVFKVTVMCEDRNG
jgi:hypothetical protein